MASREDINRSFSTSPLDIFSHAQSVELRRTSFCTKIKGRKYDIPYKASDAPMIMMLLRCSISELSIVECPCECSIESTIARFVGGARHLKRIIIYDVIPDKYELWIRRNTYAHVTHYLTKIAQIAKCPNEKTLVINSATFATLLIPFTDRDSYQSIKTLEISCEFNIWDLYDENIRKFVHFLNGFSHLTSIEAHFTLRSLQQDGYGGFDFYDTMKELSPKMFDGISSKLKGVIHFCASVNRFENMDAAMRKDIQENWSKAKNPITIDKKNSMIQRKFKLHKGFLDKGLFVEMTIDALFTNL